MNPKDRAGAKKPNLSVLPFAPLLDVIPALYEGRRKYGPWNWRAEEVSETIYADAAIRHLMQFIAGEDIDPDSGVHHISKAIAGLLVVRDAQIHGCSIDDRYVNQDLQIDKQIEQLAGINERYPEPVESALPPRDPYDVTLKVAESVCYHGDQGITGGETMTPEEAEKVAEYLFGGEKCECCTSDPTDGELIRWSETPAGGGPYKITSKDEGKTVEFRNGSTGTILELLYNVYPVLIEFVDDVGDEVEECYTEDGFVYDDNKERPSDIVRVYHK